MNPFESFPISFPDLGIEVNPPTTAFSIFGIDIKWYGILITVGFLLAILYCLKRSREFGLDEDSVIDALLFAVPSALIGARLYFVVFHFDLYRDDLTRIFSVRDGGLAIYGGIIFALLAAFFVMRFKKLKPLALFDLASLGFLIGQAVGRWGNFVNREAFGTTTTLPWRMRLHYGLTGQSSIDVHPCFLYESLWCLLGFLLLHLYSRKRRYDGELFLMYVAWYGMGRGFIEMLRIDSLFIPGTPLRVSLVLGFLSALAAVILLIIGRLRPADPERMQVAITAATKFAADEEKERAESLSRADRSESPEIPDEQMEAEFEIVDLSASSPPEPGEEAPSEPLTGEPVPSEEPADSTDDEERPNL